MTILRVWLILIACTTQIKSEKYLTNKVDLKKRKNQEKVY